MKSYMNECIYFPNIGYNNRRDTQNLCLAYNKAQGFAYTKDTLNKIIIIILFQMICISYL